MSVNITYKDGVLTATRIYNAAREEVFDAWVAVSKVQQWWGCAQTTKVRSEIEPRVGGKYRHVMTIKDAGDFPVDGVIAEYDPPTRLAYVVEDAQSGVKNKVSVKFVDRGGKTEVTLTHDNLPLDLSEIVTGGWSAAFDKLERFLAQTAAAAE